MFPALAGGFSITSTTWEARWGRLSQTHTCCNPTAFTRGEQSQAKQIQTNRSSKIFQLALEHKPCVHNLCLNTGVSGVWGIHKPSKKSMNPHCDCQNAIQLAPPHWFPSSLPSPLWSPSHLSSDHQCGVEMASIETCWFPNFLKRRDLTREP